MNQYEICNIFAQMEKPKNYSEYYSFLIANFNGLDPELNERG